MSACLPVNSYSPETLAAPGKLPDHLARWVLRMDDRMRVRETDTQPASLGRDTLAPWGILSVVAILGGQAVSTYYGQQQLTEKVTLLTTEVRTLSHDLNRAANAQTGFQYQLEDLRRRVESVEDAVKAKRP